MGRPHLDIRGVGIVGVKAGAPDLQPILSWHDSLERELRGRSGARRNEPGVERVIADLLNGLLPVPDERVGSGTVGRYPGVRIVDSNLFAAQLLQIFVCEERGLANTFTID